MNKFDNLLHAMLTKTPKPVMQKIPAAFQQRGK